MREPTRYGCTGRRAGRRALTAALIAAVAALVAACGSDSDSSSSSSTAKPGGATSSGVAEAKKMVSEFTAVPKWQGPTEPIKDISQLKGKLVVCLDSNFAVPFLKQLCDDMETAFKSIGMRVLKIDGKGDTNNYNAGVRTAIAQKAAGIALVAIGSSVIGPALKRAKAAGIPVTTTANDPLGSPQPPEIGANITVDYTKIGQLQAAYAVAVSNGNVNAHGFYGGAFPSDVAQAKGQKDELARLCPSCKLKQESVLISNFPTTVPPIVQTAIRADPKLNWFFPTFDALNLYVVPAVTQAGAAKRVQSTSHNAIAANLKYVLKGQVQSASIGENTTWWAYATADNLARLMVGQAAIPDEKIPLRIFDKKVLEEAGGASVVDNQDALFGDVPYREKYAALWGLG